MLKSWLPDRTYEWRECCQYLHKIPQIDSLSLDITIKTRFGSPDRIEYTLLETVLSQLKGITTKKTFEVEVNMEPTPELYDALGDIDFSIIWRERIRNIAVYGVDETMSIK
jgi:hypothetical protein